MISCHGLIPPYQHSSTWPENIAYEHIGDGICALCPVPKNLSWRDPRAAILLFCDQQGLRQNCKIARNSGSDSFLMKFERRLALVS
jgi:hypothetical protein